MHGSAMWRGGARVRALRMTAAWMVGLGALAGPAQAAGPQADPMTPPAISVSDGAWAYGGTHPADGDTFTATPGAWSGIGNAYEYQWQRCPTAGGACQDLPGATSPTHVAATEFGGYLRVAVTATNPDGSTTAYSALTAKLADESAHLGDPEVPPVIAGSLRDGDTVSFAGTARFTGSLPLSAAVLWERCDGPKATEGCTWLEGSTSEQFTLQPEDVGSWMRVHYRIFNGAGHETAGYTARFGPVAANTDPPSLVTSPTVSAPSGAVDGAVLQGTPGTWAGAKPIATAYQWQRCDGDGAACGDLAGETSSQHTAGPDDIGHRLRLRVNAANAYGGDAATTEPSAVVAPAPPSSIAAPAVTGTALDGEVLTGVPGSWRGTAPIERASAWERCDADGNGCVNVEGATGGTYLQTPDDVGHRLRFKEVATNGAGTAASRSAATAVVRAIAPAVVSLPVVTGTARDEQELAGTDGTWSGSPEIAFARQWMRCTGGGTPADCSPIAGATGATYSVAGADVGSRLRLRVTASNFGNATEAFSEATGVVDPVAPHSVAAPEVSGAFRDGEALTATLGTWKGTGPLITEYRWERCDASGAGCATIEGAAAATYRQESTDVGHRIRVVVRATGPGGSAEAASAAGDPVAAVAPGVVAAPELSGEARDGATLTATEGTWGGTVPMARTVRWERCDADAGACSAITGAEGTTYTAAPADIGRRLRAVVHATNAGGSAEAATEASAVVGSVAPENVAPPLVTGTPRDEDTLTASTGEWTGSPTIAFSRQWLRCSSASDLGGCETVPGAAGASYPVADADVGAFLRVRVLAANPGHEATALSAAVGPVAAAAPAPVAGEGPRLRIAGDPDQSAPDVGDRLVVERGRWTGTDLPGHAIAYDYRWERCTPAGCVEVPGRSGAEQTATKEDAGAQLRVVVTAANPTGSRSEATPRLGATRGALEPAATVAAGAPAAVADPLTLPAGSLLAPQSCQTVGRRSLAAGGVKVVVAAGTATAAQPLPATVSVPARVRRARLSLGGRALRLVKTPRSGRFTVAIKPAALALSPQLGLVVTPRRGRPVKASTRLTAKPCVALLSVKLRGTRLALRVDQRTPMARVAFTLPKGLAIRLSGGRAGTIEVLPFGPAAKTAMAARPGREVTVAGRTITLSALPPRTSAVTLSVTLAGRGKAGKALAFSAAVAGEGGPMKRLTSRVSVRR